MKVEKKQKYIPTALLLKTEELAKKIRYIDFVSLGFVKPPSANDILLKAIILGLQELEKQLLGLTSKNVSMQNTQEFEQNKKQETTKLYPPDEPNKPKPKTKKIKKDILGDFL